MSWDEIWIKKGNEDTENLNDLNGFDVNNLNLNSEDTVNNIIDYCKIEKKDKILEIGAGAGRLGDIFLKKNYNYYATEKSESLVKKFKLLVNENRIKFNKTNDLPFKENSFDVVFCWSIIQYFDTIEDFFKLFNEMKRVATKIILLGDIYEIEENNNNKKYKYNTNKLKHLFIKKNTFKNLKEINKTSKIYSFNFYNFNNSTSTRYNCIFYLNKKLDHFQKIDNFFNNSEIEEINKEILKLEKKKDIKNYIWKFYDHFNNDLSRIEYFVNYSEKLKKISSLFFKNKSYYLMKDKVNFKYPNGEGFAPHQDAAAGWLKYSKTHYTIAISLIDTTIENGCIWIADINCNKLLTKEFVDLNNKIVDDKLYKPITTKAGDILIFDSFVPHKSYVNKTNKARKMLFFTYAYNDSKNNTMYEDYHNDKFLSVPPNIYRKEGGIYRSGNTFIKR
jgi:ubiquinone/menaquinone biosynthesis C-methylase UbiE